MKARYMGERKEFRIGEIYEITTRIGIVRPSAVLWDKGVSINFKDLPEHRTMFAILVIGTGEKHNNCIAYDELANFLNCWEVVET